jgi:hypothetical protein
MKKIFIRQKRKNGAIHIVRLEKPAGWIPAGFAGIKFFERRYLTLCRETFFASTCEKVKQPEAQQMCKACAKRAFGKFMAAGMGKPKALKAEGPCLTSEALKEPEFAGGWTPMQGKAEIAPPEPGE